MRPQLRTREVDLLIARLAGRQDGVVDHAQLVAAGVGARAIGRRIEAAQLHVLHRGVYAVGRPQVTRRGAWRAAVFAGGPGAVLSHLQAAFLWGLLRPTHEAIHVTTPRWLPPAPACASTPAALPADEVTIRDGIPTSTVARTLLDLAATVPLERLDKAMNEAEITRLGSPVPTRELMARHPRRRVFATCALSSPPARSGRGPVRISRTSSGCSSATRPFPALSSTRRSS
jgi:hypothetical protein